MRIKKLIFIVLTALISVQSYSADNTVGLTHDARNLLDWVLDTTDHQQLPFVVIDKKEAKVFVFTPAGKLHGASSALMGVTVGDNTVPGVGNKKLSDITIAERTTPAGRFEADLGLDLHKSEILWIDYESGVSMHPVVTAIASERRLQRLKSQDATEHRITYGCINVPGSFYKEIVQPTFKHTKGIVYILPEMESIRQVFGAEAARYSQR